MLSEAVLELSLCSLTREQRRQDAYEILVSLDLGRAGGAAIRTLSRNSILLFLINFNFDSAVLGSPFGGRIRSDRFGFPKSLS